MSCFQLLKLNGNTADISITEGNTINIAQVIRDFSVKTPVEDFKIIGDTIYLYSRNIDQTLSVRTVKLPAAGSNASISVNSTASILTTIQSGVITSSVKVSQTAGNAITLNNDGLYVSTGASTPLLANNSSTISFTQGGSAGHTITASVLISTVAGNTVQVNNDGIYVPAATVNIGNVLNSFIGIAPIVYTSNGTIGSISITKATSLVSGYLASTDFVFFSNKLNSAISVGTGVATLKQVNNTTLNAELRSVKAGSGGITVALNGDDIIINSTNLPPVVNAGTAQSISTTTTNLSGSVNPVTGGITSTLWSFLSGPVKPLLSDYAALAPTISGMSSVGNYKFRLTAINTVGLVNSNDVIVTVSSLGSPLDTIYNGAQVSSTPPNSSAIVAGIATSQNGALDVSANWISLTASGPLYCWFAIPATNSAYVKHNWYVDPLNKGNIGTGTDLFGAPTTVTIGSIVYNVWITNYATQFVANVLLKELP